MTLKHAPSSKSLIFLLFFFFFRIVFWLATAALIVLAIWLSYWCFFFSLRVSKTLSTPVIRAWMHVFRLLFKDLYMCTCSYIYMQAHVPLIHHSRLSLGRKKEIFSYSYNKYIFAELLYSHFCLPSPFSFSFLSPSFAFFFMCLGKTEDHKPVDFIVVDNYRESWDLELNRCET